MGNDAVSAQTALLARKVASVFVTIAELKDFDAPGLMRNVIETTSHNDAWATHVPGVARMDAMSVSIGWVPQDPSHDDQTGLIKAFVDASRDIYQLTLPAGETIQFSGYVTNFKGTLPVDDEMTADVTIQPVGVPTFNF